MKEYKKYLTELFGRNQQTTVEDVYKIIFDWGHGYGRDLISKKLIRKLGIEEMKAGEIEAIIMDSAQKVFEKYKEELKQVGSYPDFKKKEFVKTKEYQQATVGDDGSMTNFADIMYDLGLPDEMRETLETEIKQLSYDEIQNILEGN